MKRILLVFLASSLFVACNNDKKGSQTKDKGNTNAQDTAKNDKGKEEANGDKDTKTNSTDFTDAKNSWTSMEVNAFLSSCIASAEKKAGRAAATEYCECMLDRVRAEYPDYNEANTKLANDREKMGEIAKKCNPSEGQ